VAISATTISTSQPFGLSRETLLQQALIAEQEIVNVISKLNGHDFTGDTLD
jgi:hypothetical protein